MNKAISIIIFGVGVTLMLYGISASHSFSSDVSRVFTGSPTERTLTLLCGGLVFAVLGGYGMSRESRRR